MEVNQLQLRIKSLELERKNSESEVKNLMSTNEMLKARIGEL